MLTDDDQFAILRDANVGSVMLFDTIERIVATRTADLSARLAAVEALHTRRECLVYDDEECAERSCEHPDGTCIVVASAVCAHCADQTEPDGDWEHMIREAAYWPCATTRAALHPDPSEAGA